MDRSHKCIVQYRKKQRYVDRDDICCSAAAPNQLLIDPTSSLRNKSFERILDESPIGLSILKELLTNEDHPTHWLTLRPISNDTALRTYEIIFKGALDASNEGLFSQLDELAHELWVPEIEMTTGMSLLTRKACLVIGYLNLLTRVKLEDDRASTGKQDLCKMSAQLISIRMDQIVTQFMEPVRSSQGAIDPEYRDGLALWYLYLPQIKAMQPNQDSFRACDNSNLIYRVWNWVKNLDGELTKRLKADCKSGFNWDASFSTLRGLSRGLRLMEVSELSINLVSFHGTIPVVDDSGNFALKQQNDPMATFDGSSPIPFHMDHMLWPPTDNFISPFVTDLHLGLQSPGTLSMVGPAVTTNETHYQIPNDQSYHGGDDIVYSSGNLINLKDGGYPTFSGSNFPVNPISNSTTSPSYSFDRASASDALNGSSPNADFNGNAANKITCPNCGSSEPDTFDLDSCIWSNDSNPLFSL